MNKFFLPIDIKFFHLKIFINAIIVLMIKKGGILLAGGKGTRLYPNTKILNKHLMPIYDKPMIYYSLSILLLSQVRDITIVCNPEDELLFKNLLGNGEEFGVDINYSKQSNPSGIPDAINTALDSSCYQNFMAVLGDNFLYGRDFYGTLIDNFNQDNKISIYYQKVKNPSAYGIIKWNDDLVEDLIEKPKTFISNDAVVGLYNFDDKFSEYFEKLEKSERNEFEIVDIIKSYNLSNISTNYIGRGTAWFDMGSSEDFFHSSQFVKTIQDRQGLLVCSPHEIAFRNGWINSYDIERYLISIKGSEYAENLSSTLGIS
jgi:glucose-1-phosphate thymidylyltransferase